MKIIKKTPWSMKFLLVLLTILLLGAGSLSGYLYFFPIKLKEKTVTEKEIVYKPISMTRTIQELEKEKIDAVDKEPKDINQLVMTGWIPDWDIPDGLAALQTNQSKFKSISPVWFWVNADGTLKGTSKMNDPEFISYCRNNGIELIPAISMFDHAIFSSILNSQDNFDRHINAILEQVLSNGYDGIDIDYESTKLSDRDRYFEFLEVLSGKLKENNKKFVVTVLSKWGETFQYNALRETRQVQDYKRISDLADEVRIMAYEFLGPNSIKAGPIAPIDWMENILKYAISVGVPREELVLGIHTYAYDWPTDQLISNAEVENMDIIFSTFYSGNNEKADAFYYVTVEKLMSDNNLRVNYNSDWAEGIGTYTYDGKNRTVVFMNNEGLLARKQLAADYGIKGVSFWRIGDEGGLVY